MKKKKKFAIQLLDYRIDGFGKNLFNRILNIESCDDLSLRYVS